MATVAVEQRYGSLSSASYPSGYDSTKLNLGSLMIQKNGATNADKYVGPFPIGLGRPMEAANGAIASAYPNSIQWSSTVDWVFLAEISTAAANRRISYWTYDRTTSEFTWRGAILVLTHLPGANHTIKAFRMSYDTYTTGTVSCAGGTTAVTGSGTAWQTSRLAVGSRIGFGTTDPTAVVTWYEIASIGADGAMVLATNGPVLSNSSYVIEDLRAIFQTTSSATASNGELVVVKGLRPDVFVSGNPTIFQCASVYPAPTAVLANHTSNGTIITVTTAAAHNLTIGQAVYFNGWVWAAGGGVVNGTWLVNTAPSTTTFTVTPTTCPTTGTNPTQIGTIWASNIPMNTATAGNHTSNGIWATFTTVGSHNLYIGQQVTLSGWTWAGSNSGVVNGTWPVVAVTDATHFSIAPTVCPTAGSNPTVIPVQTANPAGIVGQAGMGAPSSTTSDHTTDGAACTVKTSTPHNLSIGMPIYLTGWTWNTGGGVVNGATTVSSVSDSLHFTFTPAGTCPTAASNPTVVGSIGSPMLPDNIRASYWIADTQITLNPVNPVGNQFVIGCGIMPKDSWTQQYHWSIDCTGTQLTLYKYNLRAQLTAGRDYTNPFVLKTTTYTVTTTAPSTANNGRYVVTQHGPGSGVGCLYFTDLTKIYRTKDVTTITAFDQAFIAPDAAIEMPPGSTNTFGASSLLGSVEYSTTLDMFYVTATVANSPFRSYCTKYRPDNSQWDRVFLGDIRQIDQAIADIADTTPVPSYLSRSFSIWAEGGVMYLVGAGTAVGTNLMYAVPFAADWEYASSTDQRVIAPAISTPNCANFIRAYVAKESILGSTSGYNLGIVPEPVRTYYRTYGIADNSGPWTLIDDYGDLSSVQGASSIQFMFEFRTLGVTCVPGRVLSMTVLYNDYSTDSHFQPSAGLSDKVNKRFAWRFSTAFGTTVPTLYIRLFDAVTGNNLMSGSGYDTSVLQTGTWEKSTDGGSSWGSWNNTDKVNEITYLRYTPASLGDNIKVRALLTQS